MWEHVGDDVEVMISRESFRPNTPWVSDMDDYLVVARDTQATAGSVAWSLTEDGNDVRTEDEVTVTMGDVIDARHLLQMFFEDEWTSRSPLLASHAGLSTKESSLEDVALKLAAAAAALPAT